MQALVMIVAVVVTSVLNSCQLMGYVRNPAGLRRAGAKC
ncbi:hypothetical protein SHVI106290_00715 [Shewanella violacea]